jgi:hypothetical protein
VNHPRGKACVFRVRVGLVCTVNVCSWLRGRQVSKRRGRLEEGEEPGVGQCGMGEWIA